MKTDSKYNIRTCRCTLPKIKHNFLTNKDYCRECDGNIKKGKTGV